jgi:hypothetical protein
LSFVGSVSAESYFSAEACAQNSKNNEFLIFYFCKKWIFEFIRKHFVEIEILIQYDKKIEIKNKKLGF